MPTARHNINKRAQYSSVSVLLRCSGNLIANAVGNELRASASLLTTTRATASGYCRIAKALVVHIRLKMCVDPSFNSVCVAVNPRFECTRVYAFVYAHYKLLHTSQVKKKNFIFVRSYCSFCVCTDERANVRTCTIFYSTSISFFVYVASVLLWPMCHNPVNLINAGHVCACTVSQRFVVLCMPEQRTKFQL